MPKRPRRSSTPSGGLAQLGPPGLRRHRARSPARGAADVRVPLAFAAMAARMVPGIPDSYRALIEQAVESDAVGPIVDLAEDEDGDAVLISIE